jgi:hypothetical protein
MLYGDFLKGKRPENSFTIMLEQGIMTPCPGDFTDSLEKNEHSHKKLSSN